MTFLFTMAVNTSVYLQQTLTSMLGHSEIKEINQTKAAVHYTKVAVNRGGLKERLFPTIKEK